ncbi:MAG: hypothetical protein JWR63_4103 [Conexibacter sp.]|nr:hypothetical protein [Conexibacter sp.]
MSAREGARPREPWRRVDWQLLVAVAALVVTLVFNTLASRDAARQAKRSANATELALLESINEPVVSAIARAQARPELLSPKDRHLSRASRTVLVETLNRFDHLAWLYNHQHLTLTDAREYWYQPMRCTFEAGLYFFRTSFMHTNFAELERMVGGGEDCV